MCIKLVFVYSQIKQWIADIWLTGGYSLSKRRGNVSRETKKKRKMIIQEMKNTIAFYENVLSSAGKKKNMTDITVIHEDSEEKQEQLKVVLTQEEKNALNDIVRDIQNSNFESTDCVEEKLKNDEMHKERLSAGAHNPHGAADKDEMHEIVLTPEISEDDYLEAYISEDDYEDEFDISEDDYDE